MPNVLHDRDPSRYSLMPYQADYERATTIKDDFSKLAERSMLSDFDKNIVRSIYQQKSEYEPGGEIYEKLEFLFDPEITPTEEQLFDAGIELGVHLSEQGRTPRGRILGYLNSITNIDTVRVGFVGGPDEDGLDSTKTTVIADRLSKVHNYMRDVIIEGLAYDPKIDRLFEVIFDSLKNAKNAAPPYFQKSYEYLEFDLYHLSRSHRELSLFRKAIEKYYPEDMQSNHEGEPINNQATELTQEAIKHRKYGIKPAYIEASIGGSWVYYDVDDLKRHSLSMQHDQIVAIVFHSPHKSLNDLKLGSKEIKLGHEEDFTIHQFSGAMDSIEPDFKIIINSDGSMSIKPEGLHTVDTILSDHPGTAQALKAEIASNFYDLATPVYDERSPGPPNYPGLPSEQREDFDPISQLLIPRIRYLHYPPSVGTDIVREIRVHDVTWFVRRLPSGWHASPNAVARAKALNVELAENETFVKAHTRGKSGDKALGHQAIRQASKNL